MRKDILLIGLIFIGLFSLNFISAQIYGCCFNPTDGLCAENTDMNQCAPFGGEFFESKACPTVEKCQKGCCTLGSSSTFVSRRECQLLSNEYQFDFPANFAAITEAECTSNAQTASAEYGACVYKVDYPPYKCKYTTKASCTTRDFYPGILCSDESLNTSCKATDKTMCFASDGSNEDVYSQDSCGNPDVLKNNCDYSKGNSCGVFREGIDKKPSKGNLICRDLNCVDEKGIARKNGETWCTSESNTEGSSPSGSSSTENTNNIIFSNLNIPKAPNAPVGSRYIRSMCLNGQIIREPCEDLRFEYCEQPEAGGEAKCKKNNYETCLTAKNDTKSCDTDSCYMFGGGISDTIFKNAGLTLCVPKVPVGVNSYNKKTSTSTVSTNENSTCGKASQSIKLYFWEDKKTIHCGGLGSLGSSNDFTNLDNSESVLGAILYVRYFGGLGTAELLACSFGAVNTHHYPLGAQFTRTEYVSMYTNGGVTASDALVISSKVYATNTKKADWNLDSEKDMIRYGTTESGSFPGIDDSSKYLMDKIDINPKLIEYLTARCQAVGDCQAKTNWVGAEGKSIDETLNSSGIYKYEENKYYVTCTRAGSGDQHRYRYVTCYLNFECKATEVPNSDADCTKCGTDGIVCSEYRCKSLGKKCDYYEKEGIGYCTRSTDNTAPKITCTKDGCPKTAIKPYTPFEFSITTDEASECKFNFNFAGGKYSEMKFDFGKGFSKDHKVILSLPGQNKQVNTNGSEVTEYQILKEGKGTLYVRCLDAAGNGQVNTPFLIPFEVMKTPDGNSPIIISSDPKSGDKIQFNTTEKVVNFKLNEPSECNWDTRDVEYDKMNNSMECDSEDSEFGTVFGYFCAARFTDITTYLGAESKFYVRCKDQPYLEGNEDDLYKRNTNYKSYEYILRPSEKLEISSFAPVDIVKKGTENQSLEIVMTTKGGAASGKAECSWRNVGSNSSGFVRFLITNSNSHKQPITKPINGLNNFEIKCQDAVGNIITKIFSFTLLIDENYPSVSRMFESTKNIKVKTDEDSICYYSNNDRLGCTFDINNATQMSGNKKEHTVPWVNDETFYIKCKDNFGNYNKDCGVIIKTY